MINPSEINLSSLPWVPLDATAGFPAQPGIYFAIDSLNQVQYIGRSANVQGRWKSHHKYSDLAAIGGVRIAYLFVDAPDLLPEIEAALIRWFTPPLNCLWVLPTTSAETAGKTHICKGEARLLNRIQEFGREQGISSANQFWQRTGLPRATAFRLWRNRDVYPDRATVETICKTFNGQPGDFLVYSADRKNVSP